MFHVRVFQKKEEEVLFIFYFLFFKIAAILSISDNPGVYSLLNKMLKLKETIVLNTRTEHIYSVLIVLAPCLASNLNISYSVLMVLAPC